MGCRWELLLVDNRSTDRTRAVALAWSDRLPLRYLYEPQPGLSAARNRGLAEARGRLALFTDDDVRVDADWLIAMADARRRWPTASFLAGKIVPAYEGDRPSWLTEECESLLAGVVVRFSLPRETGPMDLEGPWPMGANLAFDAQILRSVSGFRTDLGRNGPSLIGGEEAAVLAELQRTERQGVYVADAVVHHHTPAARLRRRFLLRHLTANGRGAVRMGQLRPSGFLGMPRWMLRKLVTTGLTFLPTWLVGRHERWIERMKSFCFYLGASWELLRNASVARTPQ